MAHRNVDVWDLHNGLNTGNNNSASLYGTANYGDYGILSLGQSDASNNAYEPAAETPFSSYYGAQMDSSMAKSGDKLLPAVSDQPLISAHSGLRANGQLTALMINKDSSNTYTTTVNVNGFVAKSATKYVYSESSAGAITHTSFSIAGNKVSVSLPPVLYDHFSDGCGARLQFIGVQDDGVHRHAECQSGPNRQRGSGLRTAQCCRGQYHSNRADL